MHGTTPLVSIGIPVYNGERFIRQALDALLAQTYTNLELIISDNASTDQTADICLEYVTRDQRIKYYRNAANIGIYANFRRVIELTSGEYFMWAAVDDLRSPTAVENCVKALLQHDNAVMAHGAILSQGIGQEELVEYPNEVSITDQQVAHRVSAFLQGIRHNAMHYGLFRRRALDKCTLGQCYGQDFLLCLQIVLLGPLAYVRAPIIINRSKKPVHSYNPLHNPMYAEEPITLWNLLSVGGHKRRKCWTVLLMGSYYIITIHGLSVSQRLSAIAAFWPTFWSLYRSRLLKEIIFQSCQPLAWLSLALWRFAHHWSFTWCLASKIRSDLKAD